jgi:hypothetical protein
MRAIKFDGVEALDLDGAPAARTVNPAGRPAQGFYTQPDQLLTIDNLSPNGFQVACDLQPENGRGLD